MSSNEYLDNLMAELAEQGIEPPKANVNNINTSNVNDKELEIITSMERITGRKFSDEQRKILEYHGNACILACAGSGKALVNGTGVLTPNGYVPIEQLKVGDTVYDECGYWQKVTGVFPQGKKKVYKVKFSDDTIIKCCKDHLWAYQTYNMRRTHKGFDVKTLEYIKDNVPINIYPFEHKTKGKQNRANIYIPMCEAVQFDKKELPLRPYLLGALLGDGCIRNKEVNCGFSFTNEDADVVSRVDSELKEIGAYLKLSDGCTYRINTTRDNKLTPILMKLGLLNTSSHNKFIPEIYKLSSVEDRLELLKGLIDTDGTCDGTNYEITLASEQLIDDIQFIVETLGMTATKSSKRAMCYKENNETVDCGEVYRLYIKTSESIDKIHYSEHRESQWKKGQTSARRTIVEIQETEEEDEMTCIKVSGLSELFLTEHCIVTHNTTISVNLIAKRILTGEIKDVNKLIYTTFSKAGADEMKERMDKLMGQLGMGHINVQVRTLHSFFLSVIRTFGLNKRIINASERTKMVRQACKDAEYSLKDDDLMIIDNLLSYQMNNLLTNKKLVESYVNTLEDLTVEKYSIINASFRKQKDDGNCMDYDDMQYYLWLWLVKWQKSSNQVEKDTAVAVRNYCKAVYTDFYIDEAQDVSKIQFEIIKAIVSDPDNKNKLDKNLVFIGDDDQCLLEDTLIATDSGLKIIKDIQTGDKVLSVDNGNIVKSTVINTYSHGINNSIPLVQITTASGRSYIATADHKVMVKIPDKFMEETISYGGNKYVISDVVKEFLDAEEPDKRDTLISRITERLTVFGYLIDLPHFGRVKTNNGYVITSAMSLRSGMIFGKLEVDNSESIKDDVIISVEVVNKGELIGQGKRVYCLNLASNHNYFANGLLTHNCIYQWRGSDPSIILTIGAKFNMQTFVLSTNYRCLNEIVDYAATGIKCNNSRFDKSMNAFNKGGSVKIYPSAKEDLCTLSIAALNQIKYWLSQGDKVSDIAVLSRNNFHLALLSNMLLREGIYCNMTEDMKLTKSYMYNDVKDIIALSEPTWKADLTAKVLWRLCRYMGANNSRIIASFQDSCALSLEDTLGWLLKHFVNKDLDFSKKLNINMQAEQQMQYQMAKLSKDTTDDMYMLYRTLSSGSREDKIRSLLYQYLQATSFMYKSKDKNRSITGLVQYVINLMKKDGVDKMLEFMRVTEQLEGGRMVIPGDKLTLTTIHSAKGREWKNVIMFGCDNVSQPSFDGIYGMIQDDIPMSDIFENIDEERRLFYVGNTRAKENLFVITYLQPSIFILEALGAFKDKNGGNNATIVELVSDNQWQERYKDTIQEKIFDSNSKYFYNPEDYKMDN